MKKYFFTVLLLFICRLYSVAQLVINTNNTPQQLVNGIIGSGVTVFNVSYTGDTSMAGTFSATGTNLGINTGIMLATGTTSFAIGPNTNTSAGNDMGLPGDSILDSLANLHSSIVIQTFDACILEFDFMTQSSSVSFRYVFGSEEYPEYVCSQFNDVFAFFISGPGITGSMNMALIPSTTIPVAINTVNSGVVGSLGTAGPHCGLGYPNLYVNNFGGATIELDGFTVPMTASATVLPCKVYHIKLMIADAGDGVYDSGVFIEAGSFSSSVVIDAGADQTICSGNTVSIGSNPSGTYSYNWSPATGLSVPNISNPTVTLTNTTSLPIIQRYVLVANSGTCLFTDTVFITVNPAPVTSISVSPSSVCPGQSLTVDYTGTTAASYNWNFGSATVLSGSGSGPYTITYSAPGQDSITVTASNPGCSGTASQTVTINPGPIASFNSPTGACAGDTLQFTFNGNSGSNAIYSWDFGSGQVISGSGAGPYSVYWSNAGTQLITLNISDNGCLAVPDSSQVLIEQSPAAFAGNDSSVCPGYPVPLGMNFQSGYTYHWSPAAGLDDPTLSNPTALISNSGTSALVNNYVLTVTTSLGCVAIDDVTVTINPGIIVDFNIPPGQCLNSNRFNFNVQGAYPAGSVFNWNFGSAANPSSSVLANQGGVSFNSPGVYTITLDASSANCVMPQVSHTVEVYEEPQFDFDAIEREACSPLVTDMINLGTDSTYTYLWQVSNGSVSNLLAPIFSINTPGVFDVSLTGTTSKGCVFKVTKNNYLTVHATPVADFIPSPRVATITSPIINFINYSSNAISYIWEFGDSTSGTDYNETHMYSSIGTYEITLIAINSGGCIDTIRGTVEINEGFDFFIPNSFSPNGDGINDYFQGYGINFSKFEMAIYDRWGKKIFETNDSHKPWDGRIKQVVQNDVYVYHILITDKMDVEHTYVGSVTVVK